MSDNFEQIDKVIESQGAEAGFDYLAEKYRSEKNYPLLFEARLMKLRHQLDLPLIQTELPPDLPEETRRAYDRGSIDAAREVGQLFLADGQIERAWPYFRAIGEPRPVAEAIEKVEAKEGIDGVLQIAFHEGVNPRKGFELVLAQYGICSAITSFGQYPGQVGREESGQLLVRTLHRELLKNLKRAVASQEGQEPETESISQLIAGRDWLFGGMSYYTDSSHVASIVQIGAQLSSEEAIRLAVELTDYGKQLAPMFQFKGQAPFDDVYVDHGVYFRALLGENVEEAIAHFRRKVVESDPDRVGTVPAQVLVDLLTRLQRYDEASDAAIEFLSDVHPSELACSSIVQLCQMAGDFSRLRDVARQREDLLSYTAALLQGKPAVAGKS